MTKEMKLMILEWLGLNGITLLGIYKLNSIQADWVPFMGVLLTASLIFYNTARGLKALSEIKSDKMKNIWTKIKAFASKATGNTLQVLPVVGTVVTNFKEDTDKNPKGKIKLRRSEWYRLALGVVVGYVLYKGLFNLEEIKGILSVVGLD